MPRRVTEKELRQLRNDLDIAELIQRLGIPSKRSEGYLRFLCPTCAEFNTATNPRTNLARCFRCRENFNPIDLVMIVERVSFRDAVGILRRFRLAVSASDDPQKS